ncbi:unnamed protein product [Lactuca saligna]|uniref:Large ribosomal subunit protein bL12c n=1 Tax=Lactuca saligna TaxID=75948 RepID=A0AA36E885_LACSI|nr:unnamed protein product [Lactuca saligna]
MEIDQYSPRPNVKHRLHLHTTPPNRVLLLAFSSIAAASVVEPSLPCSPPVSLSSPPAGDRRSPKGIANGLFLIKNFSQPAKQTQEHEEEEIEIDQKRLPTDYDPTTFDPTEHRSPPTDRVWRLVDEMSSLTLLEVAELSSIMMKKMGMKEPPVVAVMKPGAAGLAAAGSGGGQAAAKEEVKPEKSVFELKLESFEAASKIKIIKEVRSCTDLGLKEAKELVEKAPVVFKKGVSKEECEQIIEKMKGVGAKVVME